MSESRFIIYGLCDPRYPEGDPDHVFYIGKSHNGIGRAKIHSMPSSLKIDDRKNTQKAARIHELISLFPPQGYTIKVLEELPAPIKGASPEERLPHATALGLLERRYVRWAREIAGWKILNRTDGGENVIGVMAGKKHTEKTKALQSRVKIGKTHSVESKLLMSIKQSGPNNPRYGKKESEETKRKKSEALKGPKSPHFGKPKSAEVRAKIAATLLSKNTHLSDEAKRRLSECFTGRKDSEETKEKKSAAKKKWWAEKRAREALTVVK